MALLKGRDMAIDRRQFLRGAGAAAGAGLLGGPIQGFFATAAGAGTRRSGLGYGPLRPVLDHRDQVARLLLPAGFAYRSFDITGDKLTDQTTIPGRHDGMAAFPGQRAGTSFLVRNHEVPGPVGACGNVADAYDPAAGGGTTTVEVDRHGKVIRSCFSLNGTLMNC